MKHQAIIQTLTLEEKVALCSGADMFRTKALEKRGVPSIVLADGPHGLRKQAAGADPLGFSVSVPATCFPTASLTACSWDTELLSEMGAAIAEEALQEGIDIVLGPGANIKRNPLCGRNFEYFSEDPYLSGEMAAAWIAGIQSRGVGASLKHFAANNQEAERMSSDSIVDERTLREIYLPGFEAAVKNGAPATVMCAYNKLNGVHCSDNERLLSQILRREWGFQGVVVTDWGATNDRVAGFAAGLDLEMPGSRGYFDDAVIEAVRSGQLPEARVDESVDRVLELVFAAVKHRRPDCRYDVDGHHTLAQKIAASSAVLLKNEGGVLPLGSGQKIALIGALAKAPRYQGAGSSHINPTRLSTLVDGFDQVGLDYRYCAGYALKGADDGALLAEALAGAAAADTAVIVAGLPEECESEGYDRSTLAMPAPHNALIEQVASLNPNTVVVLVGGAPVEMPWLPKVKAVLNLYLAGQAGGLAAAELLAGKVNPSGKLAETYPRRYADVPSAGFYETGGKQAQYREGVYVGYRYYDKAQQDVLFPFGHGLSYTSFAYEDLVLSAVELTAPPCARPGNNGSEHGQRWTARRWCRCTWARWATPCTGPPGSCGHSPRCSLRRARRSGSASPSTRGPSPAMTPEEMSGWSHPASTRSRSDRRAGTYGCRPRSASKDVPRLLPWAKRRPGISTPRAGFRRRTLKPCWAGQSRPSGPLPGASIRSTARSRTCGAASWCARSSSRSRRGLRRRPAAPTRAIQLTR